MKSKTNTRSKQLLGTNQSSKSYQLVVEKSEEKKEIIFFNHIITLRFKVRGKHSVIFQKTFTTRHTAILDLITNIS